MVKGRFFTVANIVSLARVPLTIIACLCLARNNYVSTFVFMALAILSDAVDGKVARMTNTVSDWGKILDPLSDKISFLIFAISLLLLKLIPVWMFSVVVIRDFLILIGGVVIYRKKPPPSANIWGKLSTLFLSLFMLRQAVFHSFQLPDSTFLWATDVLGILSMFFVVFSFFAYVYEAISASKARK